MEGRYVEFDYGIGDPFIGVDCLAPIMKYGVRIRPGPHCPCPFCPSFLKADKKSEPIIVPIPTAPIDNNTRYNTLQGLGPQSDFIYILGLLRNPLDVETIMKVSPEISKKSEVIIRQLRMPILDTLIFNKSNPVGLVGTLKSGRQRGRLFYDSSSKIQFTNLRRVIEGSFEEICPKLYLRDRSDISLDKVAIKDKSPAQRPGSLMKIDILGTGRMQFQRDGDISPRSPKQATRPRTPVSSRFKLAAAAASSASEEKPQESRFAPKTQTTKPQQTFPPPLITLTNQALLSYLQKHPAASSLSPTSSQSSLQNRSHSPRSPKSPATTRARPLTREEVQETRVLRKSLHELTTGRRATSLSFDLFRIMLQNPAFETEYHRIFTGFHSETRHALVELLSQFKGMSLLKKNVMKVSLACTPELTSAHCKQVATPLAGLLGFNHEEFLEETNKPVGNPFWNQVEFFQVQPLNLTSPGLLVFVFDEKEYLDAKGKEVFYRAALDPLDILGLLSQRQHEMFMREEQMLSELLSQAAETKKVSSDGSSTPRSQKQYQLSPAERLIEFYACKIYHAVLLFTGVRLLRFQVNGIRDGFGGIWINYIALEKAENLLTEPTGRIATKNRFLDRFAVKAELMLKEVGLPSSPTNASRRKTSKSFHDSEENSLRMQARNIKEKQHALRDLRSQAEKQAISLRPKYKAESPSNRRLNSPVKDRSTKVVETRRRYNPYRGPHDSSTESIHNSKESSSLDGLKLDKYSSNPLKAGLVFLPDSDPISDYKLIAEIKEHAERSALLLGKKPRRTQDESEPRDKSSKPNSKNRLLLRYNPESAKQAILNIQDRRTVRFEVNSKMRSSSQDSATNSRSYLVDTLYNNTGLLQSASRKLISLDPNIKDKSGHPGYGSSKIDRIEKGNQHWKEKHLENSLNKQNTPAKPFLVNSYVQKENRPKSRPVNKVLVDNGFYKPFPSMRITARKDGPSRSLDTSSMPPSSIPQHRMVGSFYQKAEVLLDKRILKKGSGNLASDFGARLADKLKEDRKELHAKTSKSNQIDEMTSLLTIANEGKHTLEEPTDSQMNLLKSVERRKMLYRSGVNYEPKPGFQDLNTREIVFFENSSKSSLSKPY